jgi:hypothetical protein
VTYPLKFHTGHRTAPRTFAPPSALYGNPTRESHIPDQTETPTAAATGEDAYARRQAMQYSKNETADEAYARRLALSQPTAPSFQVGIGMSGANRNETADEAYARRVALSAGAGLGSNLESGMGIGARGGIGSSGPPAFVKPAQAAFPAFVTSSNSSVIPPSDAPLESTFETPTPSPAPAPPVAQPEDRAAEIAKRIAAAKAIAEKIAVAKGPATTEVVSSIEQVKDTTGMSGEDVVAMLAKEVQGQSGVQEYVQGRIVLAVSGVELAGLTTGR